MKLTLLPKFKAIGGGVHKDPHIDTSNTKAVYGPRGAWKNVLNPTVFEDVIAYQCYSLVFAQISQIKNKCSLHDAGGEEKRQ